MAEEKIYVGRGKKSEKFDIVSIDICLSKIPKELITTAKNGDKYIKLAVSARREKDEYGNTHTVAIDTYKPDPNKEKAKVATPLPTKNTAENFDDLPF